MDNMQMSERYEAFIKNSSEGIWLCEVEKPISTKLPVSKQVKLMFAYGYMADANEAMARMYSVKSPSDLIGLRVSQLLIESDPKNTEFLSAFVKSGYRLVDAESREVDTNGKLKVFSNSLVGVIENGHLMRAWGSQRDITEQYLALNALQKSEERLSLALEVSSVGIWEWDITNNKLTWTDELKKLWGLNAKDKVTFEKYQKLIHPEDRLRMNGIIQQAMDAGLEYKAEHRVVWPDGSIHWVLSHGKAIIQDGKPTVMLGTCMSIEDAKQVSALEAKNADLSKQQEELVQLNQSKDEFIALASHQLRTPATAVKQYIGMVLQGYAGELNEDQRRSLKVAYISNDRQIDTINDLLRVAQLDAGQVILKKEATDIMKTLKHITADNHDKFVAKNQSVILTSSAPTILVSIDEHKMRMVFENLIDNACKYSGPDKSIAIQVKRSKSHVIVMVQDEGIGINKEDIPKLFHKFSRLESPEALHVSGTGLGLYWAKKIVELHKGSLLLTSEVGKGSRFIVKIPK